MKSFELETGKYFALKNTQEERIYITKIVSKWNNIQALLSPIKITTVSQEGMISSYMFRPIHYFSNKQAPIETDIDFRELIISCADTSMEIVPKVKEPFSLEVIYEPIAIRVKEVVIVYESQTEGISFTIQTASRQELTRAFPQIFLAGNLFASHSTKARFEQSHASIAQYAIDTLIVMDKHLKLEIGCFKIVEAGTGKVLQIILPKVN